MSPRFRLTPLAAGLAAAALLPGCLSPAPAPVASPPPPAQSKTAVTSLYLGGLSFPTITGSKQAPSASKTGGKAGATNSNPPGTAPAATTTAPASGGGSSGGGNSGSRAADVTLEGFLSHPTYDPGSSGITAQVATEAELRAALADVAVTNIELAADIDLTADAATLDLALDRSISIDGIDHALTANAITISASGCVLQRLELPGAVESVNADFTRIMNSTLGGANPGAAFTATGGSEVALADCDIVGGVVGVAARSDASLDLSACNVTADIGAIVNAATLSVLGGRFTTTSLGVNVINGVATVDAVAFSGTPDPAISVTASAAGASLSVYDSTFSTGGTGIALGGTASATVDVRTSTFNNSDAAIDFNYAFSTWSATITGNNFFSNDATDTGISMATASGFPGLTATWRTSNTFSVYEAGRDIIVQP